MSGGDAQSQGEHGREGRPEPGAQRAEDLDTQRIVGRVQAGDREAFAQLYTRYFDRVYAYLVVALDDPHESEDIAQQAFIKALEAMPRYRPARAPFRAWLFAIVRNQAIDELARRARMEPMDVTEIDRRRERADDDDLSALDWISDEDLMMFIGRLPLPQRQVLMLRYMLALTHAEVARVLKRSPEDVRNLQSRAIHFIRKRLKNIGRTTSRPRSSMTRCPKKAPVIRSRRFSLLDP